MRTSLRPILLAALVAVPALPLAAQTVHDVAPYLPEDGAVSGPRPEFRLVVDGTELIKMRFKIELSRDGFRNMDYTFDGKAERTRWGVITYDEDYPGAIYVVPKPLAGGTYEWRVSAWDGVQWIEGSDEFELTIDDVPPARVEGLQLGVDRESNAIRLQWLPVYADVQGGGEAVATYNVYRSRNPNFMSVRAYQIGSVDDLGFEDPGAADSKERILFYRIVAEDYAGNVFSLHKIIDPVTEIRGAFRQHGRLKTEDDPEQDR